MLARSQVMLHSGNSGSSRGVSGFLAEALARLPDGSTMEALRADSGFCVRERISERPDAKRRRLFDLAGYTFHTVVTTRDRPAVDVVRFCAVATVSAAARSSNGSTKPPAQL